MKNYELMQELAKYPAGYEVVFGHTVTKEDMEDAEARYLQRSVVDLDVTNSAEIITLMG